MADLAAVERQGVVYARPAEYARWWDEMVTACHCQPKTPLGVIAWYTLRPGMDHKFPCGVERCVGWWWETDQVFIAQGYTQLEWLVKHEMLHAILHDGTHRHRLFHRDLSQGGVAAPLSQQSVLSRTSH